MVWFRLMTWLFFNWGTNWSYSFVLYLSILRPFVKLNQCGHQQQNWTTSLCWSTQQKSKPVLLMSPQWTSGLLQTHSDAACTGRLLLKLLLNLIRTDKKIRLFSAKTTSFFRFHHCHYVSEDDRSEPGYGDTDIISWTIQTFHPYKWYVKIKGYKQCFYNIVTSKKISCVTSKDK